MNRKNLHQSAVELIIENPRVALLWATGLGKSRAAIEMANYLQDKEKDGNIKVLLVVAETAHKSNWDVELSKWKFKSNSIKIECYASLSKYRDTWWDLIIFDEAHHLGTDLKIDVLSSMTVDNVILLSATLPERTIQAVTRIFGEFIVSKIPLKKAIEWKILPKPRVYLVPLSLDDKHQTCTIIEEWGRKEDRVTYNCSFPDRWTYLKNKYKYPNATLVIHCTEQQKYNYLSGQFEYWKKLFLARRQEFIKNKWLQTGAKRKRFLGELKTDLVRTLLHKIRDKRFICFCTSIEQAEQLGGQNAIHSKRTDSLQIIKDFNRKKINNLFAVGMLQEGQNLTDIEVGIIIQLDGQERAFIQKFGRSLRAEDPIQFIFYYENTRDTEYLKNVLEGIDRKYITKIDRLEDLEL